MPKIWPKCIFSSGTGVKTGKKSILDQECQFGQKWPKIWPKCIFRSGKGLKGIKNHFLKKNLNLAENGRKYGKNAFLGLGRG